MSRSWRSRLPAFVATWLLATAWGTLVQTQFNLHALLALGADIPLALRLRTSAEDLVGFGPPFAALLLAAWLPAFFIAARLVRRWPQRRAALYALAGGSSLVLVIRAIDAVAPMPVLIDATRSTIGLLAVAAGSVIAGALYGHWTGRRT